MAQRKASHPEQAPRLGRASKDALAWTGVKHSGRGASLSVLGYQHLTRPKSFHLRIDT
jgi:hypothetical protein